MLAIKKNLLLNLQILYLLCHENVKIVVFISTTYMYCQVLHNLNSSLNYSIQERCHHLLRDILMFLIVRLIVAHRVIQSLFQKYVTLDTQEK